MLPVGNRGRQMRVECEERVKTLEEDGRGLLGVRRKQPGICAEVGCHVV
jgi:hypothetical protein